MGDQEVGEGAGLGREQEFAAASGLPLLTVRMLQVVVFSTVLLPFERRRR